MADVETKPALPPIIATNLASGARALLTTVAGVLVTNGAISADQTSQFVNIGAGIVTMAATFAWAWFANRQNAKKLVAAAATGDPQADPATPETKAAVSAAILDPNSNISAKGASS